jgi:hypothetical protein
MKLNLFYIVDTAPDPITAKLIFLMTKYDTLKFAFESIWHDKERGEI